MSATIEQIAELEWANYAGMIPAARVTPGLKVILRDDVVLNSSTLFRTPDLNHACLLRAGPETVELLIDEVIAYFRSKWIRPAVMVSPACTPADLPDRLLKRGFVRDKVEDVWLVADDLLKREIPSPFPNVVVRQAKKNEALTFARIFMKAFELPVILAPLMALMLRATIDLPETHSYLAFIENKPVGTCTLVRYKNFGILGSGGILPEHRRSGAATNLALKVVNDAREHQVDTLIGQAVGGGLVERLLRLSGFKRVFSRIGYSLPRVS